MKKILVFVPAYFAEKTIINVIRRTPKNFMKKLSEFLIIDDYSKDNTYNLTLKYKTENNLKKVKVIKNRKNLNYGGVQKKAYNYAIREYYDYVVMLHGDEQYPPELMYLLVKKLENSDLVIGSRMLGDPKAGGMPSYKILGNKLLTFIQNTVLGTNLSEFHSGFRAYSVEALKKVPFINCSNNYVFDTEIIAQFKIAKLRITEISIPTHYGNESRSITFIGSFKVGYGILRSVLEYLLRKITKNKKFYF